MEALPVYWAGLVGTVALDEPLLVVLAAPGALVPGTVAELVWPVGTPLPEAVDLVVMTAGVVVSSVVELLVTPRVGVVVTSGAGVVVAAGGGVVVVWGAGVVVVSGAGVVGVPAPGTGNVTGLPKATQTSSTIAQTAVVLFSRGT